MEAKEVIKLTLTISQRLNVMSVLNRKCKGEWQDKKVRMALRVYNKIEIPETELSKYQAVIPGGGVILLDENVRNGPEVTIELTRVEAEKLEDILDGLDDLRPVDFKWFLPLMEQLTEPTVGKKDETTA